MTAFQINRRAGHGLENNFSIRPASMKLSGESLQKKVVHCVAHIPYEFHSLVRGAFVSYRIYDIETKTEVSEGDRSPTIKLEDSKSLYLCHCKLKLPACIGKYLLEISMVKEGFYWLEEKGMSTWTIPIDVEKSSLQHDAFVSSLQKRLKHSLYSK